MIIGVPDETYWTLVALPFVTLALCCVWLPVVWPCPDAAPMKYYEINCRHKGIHKVSVLTDVCDCCVGMDFSSIGVDSGNFTEDTNSIPRYVFFDTCNSGPALEGWYNPSDFNEIEEEHPNIVGRI